MHYMFKLDPNHNHEHAEAYGEGTRYLLSHFQDYPATFLNVVARFETQEAAQECINNNIGRIVWANPRDGEADEKPETTTSESIFTKS